jgi:hypothetical protein
MVDVLAIGSVGEEVPQHGDTSDISKLTNMIEKLLKKNVRQSVPPPQVTKYSGDPSDDLQNWALQFARWKGRHVEDDTELVDMAIDYLDGRAREFIIENEIYPKTLEELANILGKKFQPEYLAKLRREMFSKRQGNTNSKRYIEEMESLGRKLKMDEATLVNLIIAGLNENDERGMSTIIEDWDTRVPSLEELKRGAKKFENLKAAVGQGSEDRCRCGAPATNHCYRCHQDTEQETVVQTQDRAPCKGTRPSSPQGRTPRG